MNAALGWGLAVLAVAVGWQQYGWQGVVLAVTVAVFWMLLQFSRALRVMRLASANPVGRVPNAVMFHAGLRQGLRLMDILKMTRSLGTVVSKEPEIFRWDDAGGDSVEVELQAGKVTRWTLRRAASEAQG